MPGVTWPRGAGPTPSPTVRHWQSACAVARLDVPGCRLSLNENQSAWALANRTELL
jgi:hypothetical protein